MARQIVRLRVINDATTAALSLSDVTWRALRVTLHSTLSLTDILPFSRYSYVLTGKFGQDLLEWQLSIALKELEIAFLRMMFRCSRSSSEFSDM